MRRFPRPNANKQSEGFSLLEALAALLVISVALIPLYQMQSTLSDASRRAKLQAERVTRSVDVVSFFKTLNPMAQPRGDQAFEGATLAWTAKELERLERSSPLLPKAEASALFLVEFTITDENSRLILSDTVYLVGWSASPEIAQKN